MSPVLGAEGLQLPIFQPQPQSCQPVPWPPAAQDWPGTGDTSPGLLQVSLQGLDKRGHEHRCTRALADRQTDTPDFQHSCNCWWPRPWPISPTTGLGAAGWAWWTQPPTAGLAPTPWLHRRQGQKGRPPPLGPASASTRGVLSPRHGGSGPSSGTAGRSSHWMS